MDCEKALVAASARLDGELDAAEAAELGRHLGICPECREAVGEMERLQGLLDKAPALDGRRGWERLDAALKPARRHRVSFLQWTLRAAAVLAAVALLASFWGERRPSARMVVEARPLSPEEVLSARLVESALLRGGQSQEEIIAQVGAASVLDAFLPRRGTAQ